MPMQPTPGIDIPAGKLNCDDYGNCVIKMTALHKSMKSLTKGHAWNNLDKLHLDWVRI